MLCKLSDSFDKNPHHLEDDFILIIILLYKTDIKLSATELKTLLHSATAQTHVLFKGSFYDQVHGVSMGSPLAAVLANLFMGHNEKDWIENYKGSQILFYRRYVTCMTLFAYSRESKMLFPITIKSIPNTLTYG